MTPTTRGRRNGIAIAAILAVLLAGATLVAATGGSGRRGHITAYRPHRTARLASPPLRSGVAGFAAVPPVIVALPQTPVQQRYDQALAEGLGSSSTLQAAEATPVPAPAFSGGWEPVPLSYDPGVWTGRFVRQLLDINFAHQSRADLGAWLCAEEAPELLPGVPVAIQNKVLYLSLFDAGAVGASSSPVPSKALWRADARAGAVWSVSDLLSQPDPRWSAIIADGWQPVDERFGVEDVSGALTVSEGGQSTTHRFSLTLYTGSAHWHAGYGSVLVNAWTET